MAENTACWRVLQKREVLEMIKSAEDGAVLSLNNKSPKVLKDPVVIRAAKEKNIKLK
ncbi:MAG: hypothetical protein ABIH48_01840 [Candidatus Falkowbacteria bacterium]